MKVVLVGGEGSIGSHISKGLAHKKDLDVVVFDKKNSSNHDIFKKKQLVHILRGAKAVVHLVAIPHQLEGTPWKDYAHLNVMGTSAVLAAAKVAGVRRFIYISTGAVYGLDGGFVEPETYPIQIDDLGNWDGLNFYARSKVLAEEEVTKSRGFEKVILRVNWPGGCPNEQMLEAHKGFEVSWELLSEIVYASLTKPLAKKNNIFNAVNTFSRDGNPPLVEVNNRLEVLGV